MFPDVTYLGWRGKENRKNKAATDSVLQRLKYCDWIKTWTCSEVWVDTKLQEMGLC